MTTLGANRFVLNTATGIPACAARVSSRMFRERGYERMLALPVAHGFRNAAIHGQPGRIFAVFKIVIRHARNGFPPPALATQYFAAPGARVRKSFGTPSASSLG